MASSRKSIGEFGRVRAGLEDALQAASHLTGEDRGLIEAARSQADKVDAWDVIVEWARDDADQEESGTHRPAVPANDNVTPAVLLKMLQALGLTPEARGVFDVKLKGVPDATQQAVASSAPFDPSTA